MKPFSLLFTSICAVLALSSCKDKKTSILPETHPITKTFEESAPVQRENLPQTCYERISEKDTVYLQIEDNLGTLIGKMRYKGDNKNNSNGEIFGTQNGDTLKLSYSSLANGTKSLKEIWLLKKDDELIVASGNYDATNENYLDYKKLKFNEENALKSVECKDFDKNFSETKSDVKNEK